MEQQQEQRPWGHMEYGLLQKQCGPEQAHFLLISEPCLPHLGKGNNYRPSEMPPRPSDLHPFLAFWAWQAVVA